MLAAHVSRRQPEIKRTQLQRRALTIERARTIRRKNAARDHFSLCVFECFTLLLFLMSRSVNAAFTHESILIFVTLIYNKRHIEWKGIRNITMLEKKEKECSRSVVLMMRYSQRTGELNRNVRAETQRESLR